MNVSINIPVGADTLAYVGWGLLAYVGFKRLTDWLPDMHDKAARKRKGVEEVSNREALGAVLALLLLVAVLVLLVAGVMTVVR